MVTGLETQGREKNKTMTIRAKKTKLVAGFRKMQFIRMRGD